jgi:DNA-binding MarR family transcriptional regulator
VFDGIERGETGHRKRCRLRESDGRREFGHGVCGDRNLLGPGAGLHETDNPRTLTGPRPIDRGLLHDSGEIPPQARSFWPLGSIFQLSMIQRNRLHVDQRLVGTGPGRLDRSEAEALRRLWIDDDRSHGGQLLLVVNHHYTSPTFVDYTACVVRVPADLPSPHSERQRLTLRADLALLTLAERLRHHWSAHAAAAGLSPALVKVLLTLSPGDAVPMRVLAAQLDYDASNLTTLVDRLERRGAVQRRSDFDDRRVKALVLTSEGERLRAAFWHDLVEDPGPLAPLDKTDLQTLISLLDLLDPKSEH